MIETQFSVQNVVFRDAVTFLEVRMQVDDTGIFLFQFFTDLIDPVRILAVGDRHDGRTVIVTVLFRVDEGLFHPQTVAPVTSSSAFRFFFQRLQFLRVAFIVISVNNQRDRIIIQDLQIGLQSVQTALEFFVGVDVGIGKKDSDVKEKKRYPSLTATS